MSAIVALLTVTVFASSAVAGLGAPSEEVAPATDEAPAIELPITAFGDEVEPRPLVEHVPQEVFDQATLIDDVSQPLVFPPTLEPTIRPGRQILTDIPGGSGSSLCTMNFIYEDEQGTPYVGTAGHCVLGDGVPNSTDPDFEQPDVLVCVSLCVGAQTSSSTARYTSLGEVLYARQQLNGTQLGEDYAFIEVTGNTQDFIEPQVPVWGGPADEREEVLIGEQLATYGQGVGFGDAELDARSGVSLGGLLGGSQGAFGAVLPGSPGDSGGPVLSFLDPLAPGEPNMRAVGDFTHLVAGASAGTLSDYAVQFTEEETGVSLELVTADDGLGI